MLTVLTGGTGRVLKREIEKLLEALKKDGAKVVTVTDSNFLKEELFSYLSDTDLFGKQYAVILDRIFGNGEAEAFFFQMLEKLVASQNHFFLLEEKLSADTIKSIKAAGGKVESKKDQKEKKRETFSIFSLADALGTRDKKNLWVLYEKAIRAGKTPEEIAGTLFWQLKTLLLVGSGEGMALHPYVKSKASRFLKNYSIDEIQKISFLLISEYHESRRGGLPLQERLERLILSL
jgi:DNA polymerase III delta subunit